MLSFGTHLVIATTVLPLAVAASNILAGMKIERAETVTSETVRCPRLHVLSKT